MSVSSDMSGLHLPQPTVGGPATPGDQTLTQPVGGDVSMQQFHNANPAPPHTNFAGQPVQAVAQNDQTDELDKEWISKAKLIVEQTKHDPFTQSKEIGRAKADYLRIRFNKHVKLGPDQAL